MTHLTEHFTLEELTHSEAAARNGWDNTPNGDEVANLTRLAQLLEQVKKAVGGKPVMINSGFRSKQVNDAVGSKDSSQHRLGCAADLRVPGMTPKQVVEACIAASVPFDQIILEFDAWTHISVPNGPTYAIRGSKMIIDKTGTRMLA
jgi:zinc D-Ala-D-Ala carboxypeptidase